jgi:hypothetical protein
MKVLEGNKNIGDTMEAIIRRQAFIQISPHVDETAGFIS